MTYGPSPEPHPHPHQPWSGGPSQVDRPQGFGPAVASVVLGLLGLVLPFLPIDLTGVRPYIGLPFALVGLVLGAVGCTGRRRGKPLAAIGVILSLLASALGMFMVASHAF